MKKTILAVFFILLMFSIVFASVSVTHYGASKPVFGSCFLLETQNAKVIIDCGIFIRDDIINDSNQKNLQILHKLIKAEAIFLTHAHLDHSGKIPLLVHEGFKGFIYSTEATKQLTLALFRNRKGFDLIKRKWFWSESQKIKVRSNHNVVVVHWTDDCKNNIKSIEYSKDEVTLDDLEKKEGIRFVLCKNCCEVETKKIAKHFVALKYNEDIKISDNLKAKFINAGHIPGSASIIFESDGKKMLFSGNLGSGYSRFNDEFSIPEAVDLIFMEATYCDKKNKMEHYNVFRNDLKKAISSKKIVWIPSLALNRTQKVLYELKLMQDAGILSKKIPIYSISSSANVITSLYQKEVSKKDVKTSLRDWFLEEVYRKGTILPVNVKLQMIRNYNTQMILLSSSGDMDRGLSEQLIPKMLMKKDVFVMIVSYVNPKSNAGLILQNKKTHLGVKNIAKVKKYDVFSDHADFCMLQKWLSKQNKNVKIYIIDSNKEHSQIIENLLKDEGWINVHFANVEVTVN
ncbi:MAG: MBL fold metallo-hydrolase [Endomicrobium sp.]|jgi:metallo-beta-lactamase family protein|nr:MBL fold metallo-hydrolase [Endomicrobium sp.]